MAPARIPPGSGKHPERSGSRRPVQPNRPSWCRGGMGTDRLSTRAQPPLPAVDDASAKEDEAAEVASAEVAPLEDSPTDDESPEDEGAADVASTEVPPPEDVSRDEESPDDEDTGSPKIPFGPFLALAAIEFLFFGETILDWYADAFL